jgi:hypothetical protein
MGRHHCEYCIRDGKKPATSSGDVRLNFKNGNEYEVPDMLPHYVGDHQFSPPSHFVDDVLNTELSSGLRQVTFGAGLGLEKVGYLSGEYPQGSVPPEFLEKLKRVMELAEKMGARQITNSKPG